MRKLLIIILILFSTVSFSQELFTWKCNEGCNLYVTTNNGIEKLIDVEIDENLMGRFGFTKYSNNIATYSIGCGNNCSYTTFINLDTGETSISYYDVLAVDAKKQLIVIPDPQEDSFHTVLITPIFSNLKKAIYITRKDMYRSSDVAVEVKFLANGKLDLAYDTSLESAKSEIININYPQLTESLIDKLFKQINFSERL